jgi:hypothetical protein
MFDVRTSFPLERSWYISPVARPMVVLFLCFAILFYQQGIKSCLEMMQWLCALPKFESKKKCYYQKKGAMKSAKNGESRIEGSLPIEI